MEIFPAIDLKGGQCVRLTQGKFDAVTVYSSDPPTQAATFAAAGARWLHVVDLDGAKAGAVRQIDIIAKIVKASPLEVQAGGGIRDEKAIENLIGAGVRRVVIGSLAVSDRARVEGWLRKYGSDRIVLAFDVRDNGNGPEILTHGWQEGSRVSLWEILDSYDRAVPLKSVLCTDIARDGMLTGTNVGLYRAMRQRRPDLEVLASGGVGALGELRLLKDAGIAGVIVGKALYEGRFTLSEALAEVRDGR
jgi:phosphoribosylformimino-5-aminoimidazole carboxamide ribotide isomerase